MNGERDTHLVKPATPQSDHASLEGGHLRFLEAMAAASPLGADTAPAALRQAASDVRRPWQRGGPEMHAIAEGSIETEHGPLRARTYLPTSEKPLPALVYLHGGGWTLLDIDTHDRMMREHAARSGWAVVGIDYPRAPETVFPGALHACLSAVRSLTDSAGDGVLSPPFALGGDSSGANLALASAISLRDRGGPPVAGLVLHYGVYDHDQSRASYAKFSDPPLTLSAERMAWFWDHYCPDPVQRRDPLASPVRADLAGLPPSHLVIAGQDILRDENLALAVKLAEAGNALSVAHYPRAPHAFLEALAFSDTGLRAIDATAAWLRAL